MTRKADSVDWRENASYDSKKTPPRVLFQGQKGALWPRHSGEGSKTGATAFLSNKVQP